MQTADAAFEALFRAHYDDLLRFAVRRVGVDAAPDVVADVFLVAWRRRADIPADAPRLWLFGVASKVIRNERRGQLRRARLLAKAAAERGGPAGGAPAGASDIPSAAPESTDSELAVQHAFAALARTDQEVLRLTEWEQLTPAEAAQVLGCSAAALRVRLHRARRRLAVAVLAAEGRLPRPADQDVIA